MEYRRAYTNRAAEVIPQWAEEHAPTSYGGFYVNDREGGVIYVGFTENQHALVESLKQDPELINPGAIREFPTPPTTSVAGLQASVPSVESALAAEGVMGQVTSLHVPPSGNVVEVGALNQQAVSEALTRRLGSGAHVLVQPGSSFIPFVTRYERSGPVVAGAALVGANGKACTAGYGARAGTGKPVRGVEQYLYFALTAGHCFPTGVVVGREINKDGEGIEIGKSRRNGFDAFPAVDAGAVGLFDENMRSHTQLSDEGRQVIVFVAAGYTVSGDSGGPVWDPETHKAVGLISGSSPEFAHCEELGGGRVACDHMAFTPLLQGGGSPGAEPTLGVELLRQG
jgi:hypothetical protein